MQLFHISQSRRPGEFVLLVNKTTSTSSPIPVILPLCSTGHSSSSCHHVLVNVKQDLHRLLCCRGRLDWQIIVCLHGQLLIYLQVYSLVLVYTHTHIHTHTHAHTHGHTCTSPLVVHLCVVGHCILLKAVMNIRGLSTQLWTDLSIINNVIILWWILAGLQKVRSTG